jgi:hypothetical protein
MDARLLEEQASDNYFQAASYRIDAKGMNDDISKVEKLTDANNLEIQAIQKQLIALRTYYGIGEPKAKDSPIETEGIPEAVSDLSDTDSVTRIPSDVPTISTVQETTIPGQLVLNQEMLDQYNRYIASGQFTDTTLSTGYIAGITTFDTDRVLQLWYDYIYGRGVLVTGTSVSPEAEQIKAMADSVISAETADKSAEIGIITDENIDQLIPAGEEVIYRIQIAANRNELSQRALSRMYYGNKTIEMINENGWYKYSVGDFDTYEEASRFRKSSGVENAFIVAYRKGTKFMPGSVATEIRTPTVYTPVGEQRLPPGLIFRIQIAASRVPLTISQLERIYNGNYPVEMITEDGWYKYQFMGVRLYSDALHILRNTEVSGAFIVAYENGLKVNLSEAKAKNKDLEEMVQSRGRKGIVDEIEYHLQLAASRVAMKQEELEILYSGSEAISVILEDGWYKYHLKAGNSPDMAEQFKQACGISKAFIVPYRRAAKILYYETFQETE